MMTRALSDWWRPVAHDDRRSVDLVRVVVALVLLTHPLHALVHPADVLGIAGGLAGHGLPSSLGIAWAAVVVQLACAVALLVPRFVVPGALGSIAVVAGGAVFLCAPEWYAVGDRSAVDRPGVEFNVLVVACLCAVLWTYWPRREGGTDVSRAARGGLEIVRIASALALLTHGWGAFVQWDFEGMREFGEAMSRHGWPMGVALVWSIKSLELVCSVLRLGRRLVVPACLGHLSYLVPAMWIEHKMRWFVVGPGGVGMDNGIEFTVVLVVCSVACILGYWPRATRAAEPMSGAVRTEGRPAT
jgi:putative oxidoreductase